MKEHINNKPHNILVLGHNGQVGTFTFDLLTKLSARFAVFKIDNFRISSEEDFNIIGNFIEVNKIDLIVNCIAYTHVDTAMTNPLNIILNTKLPIYLAKLQVDLIHISTDMVFNGEKPIIYRSYDLPCPVNEYGIAKLDGENAIQYIRNGRSDYMIIRTSWVYSHIRNNVMTFLIKNKNNMNIPIMDQIGNPTSALELSTFIISVIKNNQIGSIHGNIVHVTGMATISRLEFSRKILDVLESKSFLDIGDFSHLPAKRQKNCRISDTNNYYSVYSYVDKQHTIDYWIQYHIHEYNKGLNK